MLSYNLWKGIPIFLNTCKCLTQNSTHPNLNNQHATKSILTALAELTPNQCQSLIELRAGPDGVDNTPDDQKLESIEAAADLLGAGGKQRAALLEFFDTSGDLRRIESTGWCGGVSHRIAVIAPTGSPGQIMSWEER